MKKLYFSVQLIWLPSIRHHSFSLSFVMASRNISWPLMYIKIKQDWMIGVHLSPMLQQLFSNFLLDLFLLLPLGQLLIIGVMSSFLLKKFFSGQFCGLIFCTNLINFLHQNSTKFLSIKLVVAPNQIDHYHLYEKLQNIKMTAKKQ